MPAISVIVEPLSSPRTVQDLKAYIGIKSDDDYQDLNIHEAIKSCTHWFETYLERSLVPRTLQKKFSSFSESMEIELGPVSSIVSVEYQDQDNVAQTIAPANYVLNTLKLVDALNPAPGYAWPTPYQAAGSIAVTYVAGYSTIPENVIQAMNITIDNWIRYQSNNASGTLVTTIPFAAMQLLDLERVWEI